VGCWDRRRIRPDCSVFPWGPNLEPQRRKHPLGRPEMCPQSRR
jgi:hypothetical protein